MHEEADQRDTGSLQRRVVRTLAMGQVLTGLGMGAALSLGALLAAEVSGSPAWSGMGSTMTTLGAALLAVPLARLAQRRGRRVSLATAGLVAAGGAGLTIVAAAVGSFPLLLVGLAGLGSGTALNLQSRYAATDLAAEETRARDLSLVMWCTTVGSVVGPNLFEPGEALGRALGLPPLTGGFAIAVVAQLLGALLYATRLRPDPLAAVLASASADRAHRADRADPADRAGPTGGTAVLRSSPAAQRAVLVVALSHAVMVALMSMTPVHLTEHGASLQVVGVTISLHIAGMYALSPVCGWLTDRSGPRRVVLVGQVLFLASLISAWAGGDRTAVVTVSLVLLGLGWSASVVAGSVMVTASVAPAQRPALQGVSDAAMNLVGACGGALAGPVLASVGFDGLAASLLLLVAATSVTAAPAERAAERVTARGA